MDSKETYLHKKTSNAYIYNSLCIAICQCLAVTGFLARRRCLSEDNLKKGLTYDIETDLISVTA
jgi:hypothetical protein